MAIKLGTSWRNKPQTNSMIPGAFIFLSAGMNMTFSLGWAQHSISESTRHFGYSWYIAVIVGTLISIPLRSAITKKVLIIIAALLILAGGILFAVVPRNYDALLVGRYINGAGVGLATMPLLMHASEIAVAENRGRCLAVEQHAISIGVALQMIYTSNWGVSRTIPTYSLHGILDISAAILAVISLMFLIESPIDYIRGGDDTAALRCYSRLSRPKSMPKDNTEKLELGKTYVLEGESVSMTESFGHGFLPLVKMLMFRSLVLTFCFSLPLNAAFQYSAVHNAHKWVTDVAACLRILGAIVSLFLMNAVGRKLSSLLSMAIIGGLLTAIASLFQSANGSVDHSKMIIATYLYMCMQCVVGYFASFTSVYLGEAFPLRAKPYLLSICVIAEQIVQIVLIGTISLHIRYNLMAQGIILLVICLLMCPTMPETKGTTLAEAQRRFRKMWHLEWK